MSKHLSLALVAHCAVLLVASPALASFHLMKVEEAIGGVDGDTTQQAIQLRMRAPGQNQLGANATRLIVRDAAGANPVTLIVFLSNPANAAQGARILVVSPAFASAHPGIPADFTMTSAIPLSYLAAGRLTFEDSVGTVYWSLAWGGTAYTGSNLGSTVNDADGNFGPPFGSALPSSNNRALLFSTADPTGSAQGTSNAANYALTTTAATFTNNAGTAAALALEANLAVTKTDGLTSTGPSQPITYTIVVSNTGPDPAVGAIVTDTAPTSLMGVGWGCVGAGGGTCTVSGGGDINEMVNLPVSGSVTFTLSGIVSPTPSTLRNTASVAPPSGVVDLDATNNSATDDDILFCFAEKVVVPDGRITTTSIGPTATLWFGASLKAGNSYSLEIGNPSETSVPGALTVFAGDDGCSASSTQVFTDTTPTDPGSGAVSRRVSFTAAGVDNFFRARIVNGVAATIPLTFSWSDTTMYSPAWTTNGAFNTFYSFQNTTGTALNGKLTLLDTAGVLVSTFSLPIPAGQTAGTNTSALMVTRSRSGTARFTHDGPPGAVVAEAAIANFTISPAYVQPVKFQPVREAR